jgi:hypothetical protein
VKELFNIPENKEEDKIELLIPEVKDVKESLKE